MKYLGLDLGSRTLGIAVSDSTGLIASTYKTIRHEEEYERLLEEVKQLVEELKIEGIVLGFPKNMNNTIGPKGELSLEFKEKLEKLVTIPVYLQDERLTTKSATDTLIMGNVSRKNRKKVVDSVAATIILQTFLDKERNKNKIWKKIHSQFESDETGKNYIVYTDNSKDEQGNIEVYASIYYPDDENGRLEAIETDKEWKIIETILETLQEELKNKAVNENNEQ